MATTKHIHRFRTAVEQIDTIIVNNRNSSSSSYGKLFDTTRENLIISSQIIFEQLLAMRNTNCQGEGEEEVDFEWLCQVVADKLPDGSTDKSTITILSELFCPSRQGQVSTLDFVKSTDR